MAARDDTDLRRERVAFNLPHPAVQEPTTCVVRGLT